MTRHGGSANGLTGSYIRWRSSRLGAISDRLEQTLLLELLGPLTGKMLLDVGCGDGALAAVLARGGAQVTGLDADPAMVAAARQRAKREAVPLTVVEGKGEALPFIPTRSMSRSLSRVFASSRTLHRRAPKWRAF